MKTRFLFISFILFLIFFLSGCTTIYNSATQQKETYLISPKQEVRLGENLDQELQQKFKFVKDPKVEERLQSIVPRLIKVSDRQDIVYYFRVVKEKSLNAFALPGGFIYINSAVMDIATDDELACVIAHEIGHITARHTVKKLQADLGYQAVLNIALGLSGKKIIGDAANIVFGLTSLGYSRKDETQADKLGVKYAKKAGFDPHGFISFFEKLKKETGETTRSFNFEFLADHPRLDERIKTVKEEIAKQ